MATESGVLIAVRRNMKTEWRLKTEPNSLFLISLYVKARLGTVRVRQRRHTRGNIIIGRMSFTD